MKRKLVSGSAVLAAIGFLVMTAFAQTPAPRSTSPAAKDQDSGGRSGFSYSIQGSPGVPATAGPNPFGGGGFGGGVGGGGGMGFGGRGMFLDPGHQAGGEAEKLARELSQAKSDTERESLKAKLSQALEKQFDQRQKKHEADIEALETQIKKLKELVKNRNENRKDIVSRRLEQVVRDAQGLGW